VNRVLLTGRLTRDPEMRGLASGKNVTTFTVASNEFLGGGKEKAEYQCNAEVSPPYDAGVRRERPT
jgi:single-stranded DNA-binding protein